jgi:hypothetical protein
MPSSFTVDSQLIDDFLMTTSVALSSSSVSPIAPYVNAAGRSEVLVLHEDNELWQVARDPASNSGWNAFGFGSGLRCLAIANANLYWGVDVLTNNLWQCTNGTWFPSPAPALTNVGNSAQQVIFAGSDATLWYIDGSNNIYQLAGQSWQQVATGTCISGTADNFWVVAADGSCLNYVNSVSNQTALPGGDSASYVKVGGDGRIVAAGNNAVYQYGTGNGWQAIPGVPTCSTAFSDPSGNLWVFGFEQALCFPVGGGGSIALPSFGLGPSICIPDIGADGYLAGVVQTIYSCSVTLVGGAGGSWQPLIMPTGLAGITAGQNVTEVVTALDSIGMWRALYVLNGTVTSARLTYSGWVADGYQPQVSGGNVGFTTNQATGELIGYATGADNSVVILQQTEGASGWTKASYYPTYQSDLLQGARLNLSILNDNAWYTSFVSGGYLYTAYGTDPGNPIYNPDLQENVFFPTADAANLTAKTPVLSTIVRLPWTQNQPAPYAAALDGDGNLYLIFYITVVWGDGEIIPSGFFNQMTAQDSSTLTTIQQCGALIDHNGMARLYATDVNNLVWVMRQIDSSGPKNYPWDWTTWHPLGNDCAQFANGPATLQTSEIFSRSVDNRLSVLDQDPVTLKWTANQVQRPAHTGEDIDHVSLYKTEITALDDSGSPVSGAQVTITVEEPAVIFIAGQQWILNANDAATGLTGARGTLTVLTPAQGLHTPQLILSLPGLDPQTIYPPANTQAYLAGTQQRNGVTFSTDSLINATDSNGTPFALLNAGVTSGTAGTVYDVVSKIANTSATATALGRPRPVYVRPEGGFGDKWDQFWSEMETDFEDAWFAIRNGILTVSNAVFDEATKILQLTLNIVDTAYQQIVSFTLATVRDIASGIESVFNWVVSTIDKVIDWLKMIFDWHDIRNTQQVILYYLQQIVPFLQNQITQYAEPFVSGFFSGLESQVQSSFAALESLYGGSTMNAVGQNANASSPMRLPNLNFTPASFLSGTQVNWLIEKVEKVLGLDSGTTIQTDAATQQAAATLWSAASTAWTELWDGIQSFVQFIENSVKHPSDFRQLAMPDLLNAIEDVILAALTFVDGICEAFLQLVKAVLSAIDNLLTAEIQIPLIPKIFDEFGLGQVTALNLCSLMLALPVTVCYKLLTDGSPLFTAAQVQQITSGNGLTAGAGDIGDDDGVATAIGFCNAGITLIWAVYDTVLDLFKDSPPIGFQITDAIFPFVLQIFGYPGGIPFKAIPVGTTTEKWTLGNWCCGFATPLVDAGLLIAGAGSFGVLRYLDPVGKGVLTGIGLVNLGIGAADSALGQKDGTINGAGVAANTLSPMSNLFQWLRLESVADSTEEITFIIKPVVDFLCGAGTAVALFADTNGD